MQWHLEELRLEIKQLTKERDRLRALIEDLLAEIENTGDHDWWHNARADYEAIEKG